MFLFGACKEVCTNTRVSSNFSEEVRTDLSKFFTVDEVESIQKIAVHFERGICASSKCSNIVSAYELHLQGLQMDFIENIPIHLTYPYQTQFSLKQFSNETILLNIWNNVCALKDNFGNYENYYCFNTSGPFIDYLAEVASNSDYFNPILFEIENERFSISSIRNIIMPVIKPDFSNLHQRICYALLHLTLAEEYFIYGKYKAK